MSKPSLMALQNLRELVGYLKGTGNLGVKLSNPMLGHGKWKVSNEAQWVVDFFFRMRMANRSHRKSTSCGVHFLSLCESELHSTVSSMCDRLFFQRCLESILAAKLLQVDYTGSSSARQLAAPQGCGKVRHLSGKILWVQTKAAREGEVLLSQIPTNFNISDVGTKPLSKKRLVVLTREVGMLYVESHEPVGELEREELRTYGSNTRNMSNLAKTILRQPL